MHDPRARVQPPSILIRPPKDRRMSLNSNSAFQVFSRTRRSTFVLGVLRLLPQPKMHPCNPLSALRSSGSARFKPRPASGPMTTPTYQTRMMKWTLPLASKLHRSRLPSPLWTLVLSAGRQLLPQVLQECNWVLMKDRPFVATV